MRVMTSFRTALVILVLAIAVILGSVAVTRTLEPEPPSTFEIWVASDGSDERYSSTPQHPIGTLHRAQEILKQEDHKGPATVHVEGGIYTEWGTVWSYGSKYPTIIEGYDGTPVFSGGGTSGEYGLTVDPKNGHPKDLNLTLRGLKWVDGTNGIQVDGAHNVHLESLSFERLGTKYSTSGNGYAALSLIRSQGTLIHRPTFIKIENIEPKASYIHAVYMSDSTRGSRIIDGWFSHISGDPIRVRDGSHRNSVEGGTFAKSGVYAVLSTWHDPTSRELPSVENTISDVNTGLDYEGTDLIPISACFAGGAEPFYPCKIVSWEINQINPSLATPRYRLHPAN